MILINGRKGDKKEERGWEERVVICEWEWRNV